MQTLRLIPLLVAVSFVPVGCSRGPDFESPEVRKAWLEVNDEKMIGQLRSQGFAIGPRSGQSQMKVAEYFVQGDGVCVLFVDGNNVPPQVATAAFMLPTSEDGLSWRIAGYIGAAGAGGKLKTFLWEKTIGQSVPDLGSELDSFLSRHGLQREKTPGEDAMGLVIF